AMGQDTAQVHAFPWLEAPEAAAVARGLALLRHLGALTSVADGGDDVAVLSSHGRAMAALPLEPVYSHLLLHAVRLGVGIDMVALVALLS
ncbi:hypothetical protein OFC63_30670, partial [Escherichia coli]|nr:hypothetical protein [Escherichia coli]